MGWDFCSSLRSKDDVVRELTNNPNCVSHVVRGNEVYMARRVEVDGREARFIEVALVKKDRQSGDWGFKVMDEAMGPYAYNCPEKLFQLCPDDLLPGADGDEKMVSFYRSAVAWRNEVRAKASKKKEFTRLEVGAVYTLLPEFRGLDVRILYKKARGYVGEDITSGARYSIQRNMIASRVDGPVVSE